jgi:uncharacterized protein DUF262/uncharacterized protein DUF1524
VQIQPQFQTVGQLLSGRLFRIPEYQRAYSWGKKQREDLFTDITKARQGGDHFMATMVGLRRGVVTIGADEFVELEVVDGQQRLTTLTILLRALATALRKASTVKNSRLADDVDTLLVKGDDLNLLLLQTNHDTSHIFVDYIRNAVRPKREAAHTSADQNLVDAIYECEAFVAEWAKTAAPVDLLVLIRNRLSVIFHEIADEALVYTVFEVLNSRGLDVTWFDKLKATLMAIVFEHGDAGGKKGTLKELHNLWTDIYRTIGMRQSLNRETVRFAGTLRAPTQPSRPLSEMDAVDELTGPCRKSAAKAVECSKWILRITKAEDTLLADHRLRAVTQIVQARLVAIAILVRGFPEASEKELLRKWENVTFRIYGLDGNDARTAVGDYVRLAWRIVNERLKAESILDELASIGEISPLNEAVEKFGDRELYPGKAEVLRYFLYRYDEHLAEEAGQKLNSSQWNKIWIEEPSKSIEHIKAQSSGVRYLHRLGNLTVLPPGVNSKLSDDDPSDKVKTYESCGLLGTLEVAKAIKRGAWSQAAVDKREKCLLKWARTEWKD